LKYQERPLILQHIGIGPRPVKISKEGNSVYSQLVDSSNLISG